MHAQSPWGLTKSIERLYATALHIYPADFRRHFAREMVEAFRDGWIPVHSRQGRGSQILYGIRAILELLLEGLRERIVRLRRLNRTRRTSGHCPSGDGRHERRINRYIALATWLAVVAPGMLAAQRHSGIQDHPDAEAVTRAALDYLEGFYEGDADKIRRGVHPDVIKYGFYRSDDAQPYGGSAMSFDDMISFTNRMRESGRAAPDGAVKDIILLDILDQTAAVKVVAWWGVDYLQLAKYDGEWKILHVLWQSLPAGN